MWQKGRRLFSTAAILMLITAGLHLLGGSRSARPEEQAVFAMMKALKYHAGMGMVPSLYDVYRDLMLTMTITLAWLGVLNVVLAASPDSSPRLLRAVSWVNAVWLAASIVLNWIYPIPPPLICFVVIEAVVLAFLFA